MFLAAEQTELVRDSWGIVYQGRVFSVDMRVDLKFAGVAVACLAGAACHSSVPRSAGAAPIVGTWLVKSPEAPFPYHMFVFHSG